MSTCYLCGSLSSIDTPFFYQYRGRKIRIILCSSCGLGTLYPMLSAEEVRSLYDSDYFERDYRCGLAHRPYEEEVENLKREAKPHLKIMKRYAAGRRYLEIGCAGGAMLAGAREQGFETGGVEISKEMAEWGRKNLGLDIRTGTLEEQKFADEQFDVVFLGDVIEHIPNPMEVVREIHRILSQRGIVALAFPMELNGIVPRIRRAFNLRRASSDKPYHLFYYTLQTMSSLLERCGFDVLYAREQKLLRTQSLRTILTDLPNKAVTVVTGQWGDRGFTVARKKSAGTHH